jgi:cyclophilin family peptidyl-prolyl cis-trans isomerase
MHRLILVTLSLLSTATLAQPEPKPATVTELLEASKPTDWRVVNPEHVLYMDIPEGRVVIELDPDFAPKTVANVQALAREKYWDGLGIVRVQDNYVVQWADPNAEKPESKRKFKKARDKVPAELDLALDMSVPFQPLPDPDTYAPAVGFSKGFAAARDSAAKKMWLLHCYGAVGVGRDNPPDSGNGAELYAVIGQAPRHLDRNVTVIGRVIQGMEFLSSLPRGHGPLGFYERPEQNIPIHSIRLASDVPKKERIELEVLRTDTPLFAKWIEARRNRSEDWFHYKAGHIDVCNLPIPVRMKARP